MPEHIINAPRPIGAHLPLLSSRVRSDSSRIETLVDMTEPGDTVRFIGMFFCDRPLSFGGESITYTGREALFYFLPDKEYPCRIQVSKDAYGISIADIYCVEWPKNWLTRLFPCLQKRRYL